MTASLLALKRHAIDVPAIAARALLQELDLTPKPGLVDQANSGSHSDMDYPLFLRSIAAITPWLTIFEEMGRANAQQAPDGQLALVRPAGMACEQDMLNATGGVNTHKGGIFSLGLLCFAAGRLQGQNKPMTSDNVCRTVSEICQGLVSRELHHTPHPSTAGERQFQQFALTGARGEVESGFATIRRFVLPHWHAEQGERRLHHALLRLMATNNDSNLVSRGGIAGLRYVQSYAQNLLNNGWDLTRLQEMDRALIAKHLSPGGSADLLAVACVLAELAHS